MQTIILVLILALYSTLLNAYFYKKTRVRYIFLLKDNIVNIILSVISVLVFHQFVAQNPYITAFIVCGVVPFWLLVLLMIRFYRLPNRKVTAKENEIVCPADGNIIYINRVEAGEVPISTKRGVIASLNEFANTGIMDTPCWLIGINMTPYDVHTNCAPVDGKLILNKHFDGEYLSMKDIESLIRNERNTIVIDTPKGKVGVVQTASRLVRRIVTYKNVGEQLKQGDWFGMIKFGSQVDLIIPITCKVNVELGQQVYAKKTIIAEW